MTSPRAPRAWTNVNDVIGRADRLFVVLDDDERVPEVPQLLERGQETPVVSLVQPDGGLVEHVQDTDEAAPYL